MCVLYNNNTLLYNNNKKIYFLKKNKIYNLQIMNEKWNILYNNTNQFLLDVFEYKFVSNDIVCLKYKEEYIHYAISIWLLTAGIIPPIIYIILKIIYLLFKILYLLFIPRKVKISSSSTIVTNATAPRSNIKDSYFYNYNPKPVGGPTAPEEDLEDKKEPKSGSSSSTVPSNNNNNNISVHGGYLIRPIINITIGLFSFMYEVSISTILKTKERCKGWLSTGLSVVLSICVVLFILYLIIYWNSIDIYSYMDIKNMIYVWYQTKKLLDDIPKKEL